MTPDLICGTNVATSIEQPTPRVIRFTVHGTPRPQGSKRHVGHGIMIEMSKALKPWRREVAGMASMEAPGEIPFPAHVPLEMTLNFYFTKPKSAKRRAMTTRPDSSKLLRAIEDALTGIIYADDAQIIEHHIRKHYGGPDRVEVKIQEAIV